ncbi:signal peptide peptidase SppA [Nevskia soli]|uniref:signal peptide peptidase SppA n=1 Tax=Nevskia soli TaxID=418856 RepID=UPI0004A6FF5E|nr:signal peptide peptidase SppA [Nevskia soli]
MSESKSPVLRFFGWIWRLVVGIYRTIFVIGMLISLMLVWFAFQGGTPVHVENNIALTLIPTGTVVEQVNSTGQNVLRQLGQTHPSQTLLRDLTDALKLGATDPRIPFAVLRLDDLQSAGLPQLQELGVAMKKFRAAGKPIYVYGESFDQAQYYIAAQADEVSLDPMGMLMLQGYGMYTNYFKDALDKLGVQINVFRVGEYKSAVEPFLRNDMSPEAKLANQAWLGDLWDVYNQQISAARKLPDKAADTYARDFAPELLKRSGDAASYALDAHLVNHVETLSQFRKRLADKVGYDKDKGTFRQIDFSSYLRATRHEQKPQSSTRIALVVVEGEIVDGESDNDTAGGDTISGLLEEARHDDDVKAVVLRVNSPGGSVTASEKIRRGVEALKDDGKPVVVSMSTLAASGGYWISMAADQIWAEPSTITGSIGIFGLIPTIDQPMNKLGIHTDGVGTTPLAGAFRADRPLSPEMKTIMQSNIEHGYHQFIAGVSKGRNIPVDKVDSIARGRVWSGVAAKGLGLVDSLGGIEDAEAAAAKLADLKPGGYRIDELQPQRDLLAQWLGKILGGSHADLSFLAAFLPQHASLLVQPVQDAALLFSRFNDPNNAYVYCFCTPTTAGGSR